MQLPFDSAEGGSDGSEPNKKDKKTNTNTNSETSADAIEVLSETGKGLGGLSSTEETIPSILPPLTKEIRDDYARHIGLLEESIAKKKPKKKLLGDFGVPTLMLVLLVFFAVGVIAYTVYTATHEPPYSLTSPTTVSAPSAAPSAATSAAPSAAPSAATSAAPEG